MCLPICLNHKKFHNREKCNKLALTVTGNCHKKIPLGVGGLTTWVLILNQLLISYKVHQGFIFPRFHLDGLELRNSKVEQSAAEHAHKQPFVIAGQERFGTLISSYYRGAHGIILDKLFTNAENLHSSVIYVVVIFLTVFHME
ncbi:uncharacterized protein LOC114265336 isoform X2 [Camellia sinensis]|uniref:uncharacterized protein LOC114265336 isoform X2 n=1 Tax=Camellia sinensis TaxID=4442 RepID=UPI001035CF09|nr:uncharacterized protein LOC114265336 isoform X2 [Camellia sinensis]